MPNDHSRVLDSIAAMNLTSLEQVTELDPQTVLLIRFGALVALDAAPLSYLTHLAVGQEAGLDAGQVEDALLALAPLVGSARIVSVRTRPMSARSTSAAPSGSPCSAPRQPRLTTTSRDDRRRPPRALVRHVAVSTTLSAPVSAALPKTV